MSQRVIAHLPYTRLKADLPFFLERRLNPEIMFSAQALRAPADRVVKRGRPIAAQLPQAMVDRGQFVGKWR